MQVTDTGFATAAKPGGPGLWPRGGDRDRPAARDADPATRPRSRSSRCGLRSPMAPSLQLAYSEALALALLSVTLLCLQRRALGTRCHGGPAPRADPPDAAALAVVFGVAVWLRWRRRLDDPVPPAERRRMAGGRSSPPAPERPCGRWSPGGSPACRTPTPGPKAAWHHRRPGALRGRSPTCTRWSGTGTSSGCGSSFLAATRRRRGARRSSPSALAADRPAAVHLVRRLPRLRPGRGKHARRRVPAAAAAVPARRGGRRRPRAGWRPAGERAWLESRSTGGHTLGDALVRFVLSHAGAVRPDTPDRPSRSSICSRRVSALRDCRAEVARPVAGRVDAAVTSASRPLPRSPCLRPCRPRGGPPDGGPRSSTPHPTAAHGRPLLFLDRCRDARPPGARHPRSHPWTAASP